MDIQAFLQEPEFTKKVFFPRQMPIPQEEDPRRKILQLDIGDNVSIGGLFFQKALDLPSLLFFHGNGEIAEDYAFFADQFLDSGVNCAFVDYRGYGFSTGTPNLKNLIEDAMKIYQEFATWLITQNLSPKIFVHGRSLGSICAAEIGAQNPENLRGLIIDCGFCDTYSQIKELSGNQTLPFTAEEFLPYSNITRFSKVKKPVLIIHGNQDFIVNVAESQKTFDALPVDVDKLKVIIEGAGHNDILMYDEAYFTPIKDFITKNR